MWSGQIYLLMKLTRSTSQIEKYTCVCMCIPSLPPNIVEFRLKCLSVTCKYLNLACVSNFHSEAKNSNDGWYWLRKNLLMNDCVWYRVKKKFMTEDILDSCKRFQLRTYEFLNLFLHFSKSKGFILEIFCNPTTWNSKLWSAGGNNISRLNIQFHT